MNNLLDKIKHAFAAVNEAEAAVNEAAKTERAELVSRSKALGLLLIDAHKRYPKAEDFKKFLRDVKGLGLSRAYDFMRLAGGRVTDEQLRDEARKRQRKSRARRKKQPVTAAIPNPDSVTVTESQPDYSSAEALVEFTVACQTWLPKLTDKAHRQRARLLVSELMSDKREAA